LAKDFVPMLLPRGVFQRSGNDNGPRATPEVVVPIRPGSSRREPRRLFDPSDMPKPRTIYPVLEPEAEPEAPAEPPGPTAEEIAQMVREAEARGYERGKAEMEQAVRDRVEQEQKLQQVADAIDGARQHWQREVQSDVGRLVVESVQHICGELPSALVALLASRLNDAAEQLVDARKVVVRVAPRDIELVRVKLGDRPQWEVRADPSIRGGCRVTSENGEIDGTLEAAFRALDAAASDWRAEVEAQGAE
jgi:flagellar biosynthesis/type III secretory pathway protein FliH